MPDTPKRTVFYVSDGTGITAETLGHSLLAQFPEFDYDEVRAPSSMRRKKRATSSSALNG